MGKICSDGDSVRWEWRALPGSSVEIFGSMAEHFDWLAEINSSDCEICVEFRLCSGGLAESDKGCSGRNSVRQEGRALPEDVIGIF